MKFFREMPVWSVGVKIGSKPVEFTVGEAVRHTLDNADCFREGELERLREKLDNTNEFVSQLCQMLADSGALKVGHVAELVGEAFKVQP